MHSLNKSPFTIKAGIRQSPLSQAQALEIKRALQDKYPHIEIENLYLTTTGDRDQTTSLRTLEKTDFFTKEIDELVLQGICRIGIHSAKDLSVPLEKGLSLLCLTSCIDPADALVMPKGATLQTLPPHACIGTSSQRREDCVKQLRADLTFKDIRGTIEQRLSLMDKGEVGGVVIAEAALIRLNLTHLNRIKLPGVTAEGQGQLAVVGREEDIEMHRLFACLDTR